MGRPMCVSLTVLFLALTVVVKCSKICESTSVVSASKVNDLICSLQRVTVSCTVKRTPNSNPFLLSWECHDQNGLDNERIVFCNNDIIYPMKCQFGDVDIVASCQCDDSVIVSNASFSITTENQTLNCSNGDSEQVTVSVQTEGLQTPLLFHNNISAVSNKFYNVTVQWMSSDGSADDVQYILSIYNSSNENPMNILTLLKAVNLTMQFGVNYYITVTAERCGGKLTSNTSDVLHVFYPVEPLSSPVTPLPKPSSSESPPSTLIARIVTAVILLIGTIIFTITVIHVRLTPVCGRLLPPTMHSVQDLRVQGHGFRKVDSNERIQLRQKITGLHITKTFIYVSCSEICDDSSKLYFVLRYNRHDKTIDKLVGFDIVRGIGSDNEDNLYTVESGKDRIVKFDMHLNAVCAAKSNDQTNYNRAFGILVTDQVFVCDSTDKQIRIFDLNLKIKCIIKDRNLLRFPTDITTFEGKYFVSSEDEIIIIDIDFNKQKFKAHTVHKMTMNGQDNIITKCFNSVRGILCASQDNTNCFNSVRGICASQDYLYVTERFGRVLCLKYKAHQVQLNSVAQLTGVLPIVIAHHAGKIVCSKGMYSGTCRSNTEPDRFCISWIIHNPRAREMRCEDIPM